MLREKYLPKIHWFLRLLLVVFVLALLWIFVAYLIPKSLPVINISNAEKSGLILQNEVWSGEIHVVGDIFVLPGTTITVSPGTRILVAERGDKFNLHFLPWEFLSGLNTKEEKFGVRNGELFWDEGQKISLNFAKLYALGTKEQPIVIKSQPPFEGSPYDFNRVSIDQGILAFVQFSNYRRLEVGNKVTIRESDFANIAECAVCSKYSSPSIINNIFRNTLREYIYVLGGSPKITDNLFMSNLKSKGIVVDPQRFGSPIIYHNTFEMPGQIALEFLNGDEDLGGAVSFNDFAGESIVKLPCDSRVKLTQNQIKGRVQFARSGNCLGKFTIDVNYWGTDNRESVLQEKIMDKEAGFEISIPAILKTTPTSVGRR